MGEAALVRAAELVGAGMGIAALITAVILVRLTQKRAEEWRDLALARSAAVDDLKGQLADLREEVGVLRGAISALESVKAQEIAERVIDLMGQSAFTWDNPQHRPDQRGLG